MPAKLPRAGFFLAIGFATLAIIVGVGAFFFQFRDRNGDFGVPAIELSVGLALMTLTLLAESSGRSQRIFLGLRNAFIGFFCLAVLLVFLYGLVGPLR